MFVVFDFDGTLSCSKHRQPLLDLDPVPWLQFYAKSVDDAPIWPIINTLIAFKAAGARVEIWTGRSDIVMDESRSWLQRHGIGWIEMRMRPDGDHGPDDEMKRRWLYECDAVPDLVFEDRARVVRMWRSEGIACAHVAEGDF